LRALANPAGVVEFAADSPDEVIALSVAAIRKTEPSPACFLRRAVIVEPLDTARLMMARSGPIVPPKGQARNFAGMLARAGVELVGIGRDEPKGEHQTLTRPSSSSLGKAISTMGYPEDAGYELVRKCGRSVTILTRLIRSGSAESPEWID
jgi:hypothetical protein